MGNSASGEEGEKENNPRTLRRNVCCTDILILILFIVFWVFLIFIAVTAIRRGDPNRVLYGYDSSGNTCNQKNNKIEGLQHSGLDTVGKKNVFFLSVLHPKHTIQICIEKCPDRILDSKEAVVKFYKETGISLCQYGVEPSVTQKFDRKGPCPSLPVYPSLSVLSRCVPNFGELLNETSRLATVNQFSELLKMQDFLSKAISDISYCWKELIAIGFICIVLAFLMVVLMRFMAFIMVWLIVILSAIGSVVGTVLLWVGFVHWLHDDGSDPILVPLVGTVIKKRTAFLVSAIIASVLTVVLLLVLFVMRKRIALVVALFKEAGVSLVDMPALLIQPFITSILYALVTLYFFFIFACISTMGTPSAVTVADVTKVKFEKNKFEAQFWWIYLVGWIWTSEFVLACQEFVISCAVSIWYFTRDKSRIGSPVLVSIRTLIFHHLGSIAFGSLVISIVKIIKYILMYIERNLKESNSDVARVCLKCCICCLWCLEKILRFIHQNAYTVIAIEGTNFCTSARKAFSIITNNALRVAALNSVGDFVLFLGKVAVGILAGVICYFWLKNISVIYYIGIPVALTCIFGFLIAHVFLSVYEMVVDALLLCFCEDSDRNDGTEGREYFMRESLMEFVTNSSAKLDDLQKNKKKASEPSGEQTSLQS